jgi:enamine deaminase RidA (YjgF/YER057c/UK114 family)
MTETHETSKLILPGPVRVVRDRRRLAVIRRSVAIERINPTELGRPSGFSHAVTVTAARLVFLAGQTAHDAGGHIAGTGVVAQFEQALGNLMTALRAAGGKPADLVSLTVYAVDLDGYRVQSREIGEVWRRLAGREYPAMAAVGVQRLWDSAALVELQGIAAVPG